MFSFSRVRRFVLLLRRVCVSDCGSITNANTSCLAFYHSGAFKTAVFQSDEEGNNTTTVFDIGEKVSCYQPAMFTFIRHLSASHDANSRAKTSLAF